MCFSERLLPEVDYKFFDATITRCLLFSFLLAFNPLNPTCFSVSPFTLSIPLPQVFLDVQAIHENQHIFKPSAGVYASSPPT